MVKKKTFWDMPIEDVMGINEVCDLSGVTKKVDSDTTAFSENDTYYSRSNIAELSLKEPCAEDLINQHNNRSFPCK